MEDNKTTVKKSNKVIFVPHPPLKKSEGEPRFSADILDMTPEEYYKKHKW